MRSVLLQPMAVAPTELRWLDAGDAPYEQSFRDDGFYTVSGRAAEMRWARFAPTLQGRLVLQNLKPNFAYQAKLVGAEPVTSPGLDDLTPGSAAWASATLGGLGRWCTGQVRSNVPADQAGKRLSRGEPLTGYVLFDFLVTDAEGNADRDLSLDSSYHVLWRTDQRDRHRRDSPVRTYPIMRGAYGYGLDAPDGPREVSIFAEREVPHPGHGQVALPPGSYRALINLTEESFHANQKQAVEAGGLWAQVLEAPIEFTVTQ